MWLQWLPWRFLVRDAARRKGFLDPVAIIAQLQNFAQPSEVAAPLELLRSGVVMHARGLINSLAIQHNLDWIWPYWVKCQYDPLDDAFIPRAFSLTQINLTKRNWTALGVPDSPEFPLVDPRGLVTPFYDGWSVDVWIIPAEGEALIPARRPQVTQTLPMGNGLAVLTESSLDGMTLSVKAHVIGSAEAPICQIDIAASVSAPSRLVVSLRPYNPEGVSFIHDIALCDDRCGWRVNKTREVRLNTAAEQYAFSDYHRGDVYDRLSSADREESVACKVGMATAAAVYALASGQAPEITVSIPLTDVATVPESYREQEEAATLSWEKSLRGAAVLQIPDAHFMFLYDAAVRTMILHSPKEVYPGPYIYRRFWFRDAAFILHGLLCVGLHERVRRALDCFRSRQTAQGYFLSQEGEWDSNGEALWIMRRYCEMTGNIPPKEWKSSILKAGNWIEKKRTSSTLPLAHAGLLPAGFSAEHLGPNDFYYWDDFWAVAGLKAAAYLSAAYQDNDEGIKYEMESCTLQQQIEKSLSSAKSRLQRSAIPASPYRRLDTGAIGSLVASYPLRVFEPKDERVADTVEYLMKHCLVHGGFFHDMTHSGINPYLTLHLAQALLRDGDPRYLALMKEVAALASPTGQWPESIHPRTGGGCMGDGQHVWAAAEWVMMIRNCFVREEDKRLILCSGIPHEWLEKKEVISFGPAPTGFGDISISVTPLATTVLVEWIGTWFSKEPQIDICLPGFIVARAANVLNSVVLTREVKI